jgi:uncharacterized protein (TIGR04222 family)
MNPFDLRGPQFLLFYISLTIATVIVLGILRRRRELELSEGTTARMHDPYAIAYLRGGKGELLRVAVVSLVDRTLLSVGHDQLTRTPIGRDTEVRKRIEQELLAFCATSREPSQLFEGKTFDGAMLEYERTLTQAGLLPDAAIRRARRMLFGGAVAILAFFALTKIYIGLDRGRPILLLILLGGFSLVLAHRVAFPRQTSRGKKLLAELRNLFKSLKGRVRQIRPGGANADLALALAVFGIDVVPTFGFSWVKKLFPKASSSSSGSCGSSCGSSGCGGGGCGGGCGGCGG